jgi:HD-GYP domain-containing protein (c-di-GMP phosphodiesterase class II)
MLLARDVYNEKGAVAFKEGAKLSNSQIEHIKKQGFAGVYILDICSDDITCEPVVPDYDYLNVVRAVEDYVRRAERSEAGEPVHVTEEEQRRVVDPVMEALMGRHRLMVDVFDIKPFAIYEPCHAAMVMVLSVAIGIKLKMPEAQLYDLATAALLHDIGTAFLPEGILNRPGRLTDEEFEMVKNHVRKGYEYLVYNHSLSEAASIGVMQHHENYDGTGYPDGLRRKNISVYGRIIAVTDVYDALVSKRSFRQAMYPVQALDIIEQQADRKFDPDIVGALASFVAPYPSGSIVSLKTGETCIVKRNYPEDLARPLLRVYDERSSAGALIDLHTDPAYKGTRIIKNIDI